MTMPERNEIAAEKEEFKLNEGYYIGNHKVADFEPYVSKKYVIKDLVSDIETVSYDVKVKKQEGGESKALRVTDFLKIDYFRDLAITVVDILNGAAYLFDQKPTVNNKHWKSDLELEDFRNSLGLATKSKSNC